MIVELVAGTATSELRRAVLRPHWPAGSVMHGDDDAGALHLAVHDASGGAPIGACVLLPAPYPLHPDWPASWQLRGMAVDADWRGRGAGALLLAGAVTLVEDHDGRLIWCRARIEAAAFYASGGFAAEGGVFIHAETGIDHVMMWRTVAERLPAVDASD